jgi:3'-phosphoadenosine 5'-phosphosulfate sulfotransferase (PAPS reductase)/FAD synthetase
MVVFLFLGGTHMSRANSKNDDLRDDSIILGLHGQLGFNLGMDSKIKQEDVIALQPAAPGTYFNAPDIDLSDYDIFVLCMSGGKDSLACLDSLIQAGVDPAKIEMWHHLVDGNEKAGNFMDWAFMDDYVKKIGLAFGIPVYNSWLKHGFEGEMLKENSTAHNHIIETPDGFHELKRDPKFTGTRLKFPQVSGNLAVRWCSSALKIEVGKRGISSQDRFLHKNTLFITGERREESSGRAKYNQLEPHYCDTMRPKALPKKDWVDGVRTFGKTPKPVRPRKIDAWRPVLHYTEEQVWEAIERLNILAPVPYRAGWSRSSCQTCIFNEADIWATMKYYWPERLVPLLNYEKRFDLTIDRSGLNVMQKADKGTPMVIDDEAVLAQIVSKEYTLPIFAKPGQWTLPKGAFGKAVSGAT